MPLDRDALWDMMVMVRIAEEGSLSGAARKLHVTPSAITRQLQRLEARLNTRLIQRTTRASALTEAGERYVASARAVVAQAEAAEREVSEAQEALAGRLRISAPTLLGQHLVARAVAELITTWPALRVELRLADSFTDLVREDIDVALRISDALAGDALRARKLATLPVILCASPAYLAAHSVPTHPSQLAAHTCLQLEHAPGGVRWELTRELHTCAVEVRAALLSNSLAALSTSARASAGIVALPAYLARPAFEAGELAHVLPGWELPPQVLWAVHARGPHLSARVRRFIEVMERQL